MFRKIKSKIKKHKELKSFLNNIPSAFDDAILSWVAPEYMTHKRGLVWKIVAISLVVVLACLAYFWHAWTFSMAILSLALVYYLVHRTSPQTFEITISEVGIKIGNMRLPFSSIAEFWIIYNPPYFKTLNLVVKDKMIGFMEIQLEDQNPVELKKILARHVAERKGKTASLADVILRLLKI